MKLWRVSLFLFCLAAVLTQPKFTSHYYSWMLEQGAYRWDADSIAIPIMSNFMAWIIWGPVSGIGLFFVFRKLKAPFRVFVWDEEKKLRTWLISIGCLVPIVMLVDEAMWAMPWKNYVEIGYSMWWIAVWLLIRASLLTKRESNQTLRPTPESVTSPVGAGAAPLPSVTDL